MDSENSDDSHYPLTITDKKIRLFGFELDPCQNGATFKEKERKNFACEFCFKRFGNSQALGGHQNAHKKERMKKKRLLLQARKATIEYFLRPYDHIVNDKGINISFNGRCVGHEFGNPDVSFGLWDEDLVLFKDPCDFGYMNHQSSSSRVISSSSDDSKQSCEDLDLQLALCSYSNK